MEKEIVGDSNEEMKGGEGDSADGLGEQPRYNLSD